MYLRNEDREYAGVPRRGISMECKDSAVSQSYRWPFCRVEKCLIYISRTSIAWSESGVRAETSMGLSQIR